MAILGCNTTTARTMLTFYNWDSEAVLGELRCASLQSFCSEFSIVCLSHAELLFTAGTIAERGQEAVYKRAGVVSQSNDVCSTGGWHMKMRSYRWAVTGLKFQCLLIFLVFERHLTGAQWVLPCAAGCACATCRAPRRR